MSNQSELAIRLLEFIVQGLRAIDREDQRGLIDTECTLEQQIEAISKILSRTMDQMPMAVRMVLVVPDTKTKNVVMTCLRKYVRSQTKRVLFRRSCLKWVPNGALLKVINVETNPSACEGVVVVVLDPYRIPNEWVQMQPPARLLLLLRPPHWSDEIQPFVKDSPETGSNPAPESPPPNS